MGERVDFRVRGTFGDFDVLLRPGSSDAATRETSTSELRRLIYDFKYRHPAARRALLEIHARLQGVRAGDAFHDGGSDFDVGSPRAEAIAAELLLQAAAGNLVVRRRVATSIVVPIAVDEEPVLGPQTEPTGWIAIVLLDDSGKAVPDVAYRIECDDGRVRTGTTNSSGKAREEGLHDGSCKVTFPDLHGPEWKKAG
jgi:hypothetical protein